MSPNIIKQKYLPYSLWYRDLIQLFKRWYRIVSTLFPTICIASWSERFTDTIEYKLDSTCSWNAELSDQLTLEHARQSLTARNDPRTINSAKYFWPVWSISLCWSSFSAFRYMAASIRNVESAFVLSRIFYELFWKPFQTVTFFHAYKCRALRHCQKYSWMNMLNIDGDNVMHSLQHVPITTKVFKRQYKRTPRLMDLHFIFHLLRFS